MRKDLYALLQGLEVTIPDSPETPLEEHGLDSLKLVMLVSQIEELFEIEVNPHDLDDRPFETISSMEQFINKKR